MAEGTFNVFLDITRRLAVYSALSQSEFNFPGFTQGNVVPFVVQILKFQGLPNQFSKPDIAGMTLQFTLTDSPAVDPAGATAFVSQMSWTRDTNLKAFSADVSFTGATLNTWLAGGSSKIGTVRFPIVEGANTTEVYRQNVTVFAGSTAVLTTTTGETPISLERAVSMFVPKVEIGGDYRIRTTPGGFKFYDAITDDGIAVLNPIT